MLQLQSKLQLLQNGRCNNHQSCNTRLQLKAKLQTQGPHDCNFDGSCNTERPELQLAVKLQPKVAILTKVTTICCNFDESCNSALQLSAKLQNEFVQMECGWPPILLNLSWCNPRMLILELRRAGHRPANRHSAHFADPIRVLLPAFPNRDVKDLG